MSLTAKAMAKATASNYIHLILKIIISLMLVRIMFMGMSQESYGFWALLWSIFGYSVLLDFGLGVTIQKRSAELVASDQEEQISAIYSTYIVVYSIIALFIIAMTLVLSYFLESIFVITSVEKLAEYRLTLLVFGIGSALAFALGFIAEILRGLHLLQVRNQINTLFLVINAIGLWICVETDQPLYMFAVVGAGLQFLNNFSFYFVLKKNQKNLHFSKALIDFDSVKRSMQFSFSAYMVMFSNIIIFRTDQIVISAIAGVSFVGLYQIASRVAELFRQFSTQFHESLGTKAAMLHADDDKEDLAKLMLHSNRIVAVMATILFIPSYMLIETLLMLWLELTDPDALLSAKILLVSMYILVVFRSSMVQILLMNNRHLELMKVGIFEAVTNIILSVILVYQYGMIGAAIGTLIPNAMIALFYNIPTALKYAESTFLYYFGKFLLPLAIALGVSIYLSSLLKELIPADSIMTLFIDGGVMMIIFALLYIPLNFRDEIKSILNRRKTA